MPKERKKDVVWHKPAVSQAALERLHGHRGVTVWFTGLPSSGKSTLANVVAARLHKRGVSTFVLDGDNIRHGLNRNLGFSPEDRTENIRRIAEVAKLFTAAGVINLAAFISPYAEDRKLARELQSATFIEVFCDSSLEECERRDPKGMYRRARSGEIRGFTGLDAPYEPPLDPELHLRTDKWSINECVDVIVRLLWQRGDIASDQRRGDGSER